MSTIIEGKYISAVVYRDDIEQYAEAQIKRLCDMEIHKDAKIRIMPDVHPGKVAPIGFTMRLPLTDNTGIMPALVGNDIGCGVSCIKIDIPKKSRSIDFDKLTKVINKVTAPGYVKNLYDTGRLSGFLDERVVEYICDIRHFIKEREQVDISLDAILNCTGTLGGGNHFIELGTDSMDYYMIIHSGSRSLGNIMYEHFMDIAHSNTPDLPYEISYISDKKTIQNYISICSLLGIYAIRNRSTIGYNISKEMGWDYPKRDDRVVIPTAHNSIEYTDGIDEIIIRKGANEILDYKLISDDNYKFIDRLSIDRMDICLPINSLDGCFIGSFKVDPKWNNSSPHGAGRILKRVDVSDNHTASEYKKLMQANNIYCNDYKSTLDESPFAYRKSSEILDYIGDHFEIKKHLKPIYNYKSGNKR